jgi:hypothetical protein
MPREWGREPLYTFLPRERNEGLADTHAATVQIKNDVNKELSFNLGLGKYWLPNSAEANKNKYAMPSYNQLNVEASYAFNSWLEGTKINHYGLKVHSFGLRLKVALYSIIKFESSLSSDFL